MKGGLAFVLSTKAIEFVIKLTNFDVEPFVSDSDKLPDFLHHTSEVLNSFI